MHNIRRRCQLTKLPIGEGFALRTRGSIFQDTECCARYCEISVPPLVCCHLTCSCLAAGRGSRSCARPGGGGGGGRPLTALLIRCRRCCSQIWFWCACTKNISISEKYLLPPTNLISTGDELLLSFSKFYLSETDKSFPPYHVVTRKGFRKYLNNRYQILS